MVTSVPAWFNSKASGLIPPGFDLTFAVDNNSTASEFAGFLTNYRFLDELFQSLRLEGTGLDPKTPNRVSFIISQEIDGEGIEEPVTVDGVRQTWLMGDRVEQGQDGIVFPFFQQQPEFNGEMGTSVNRLTTDTVPFSIADSRDYNLLCAQIVIACKLINNPNDDAFDPAPKYPYRYVGIHNVDLFVRESDDLPPGPPQDNPLYPYVPSCFIYTNSEIGVAVYEQRLDSIVNTFYRENMPTSAFNISGLDSKFRDVIVNTNGAIFSYQPFSTLDSESAFGDILGKILYRYLYIPNS